jgi:glycosyltransferase involved in cell wall biosynthesis
VQAAFLRAFTRLVDGYIALSEDGRQRAVDRYPRLARTPGWVIPHGHFRASYPRGASREEARRRLGLPDEGPVLLNFGQISAYKNIPRLLAAFRSLDLPAATLLVAGSPTVPAVAEEVRAGAAHDPRVRLHLRYIPEDEVQLYFAAADVVVLPYTNILNSGNALLALSFDRPVLVPDRGSMGELRRDVGDAWVRTYAGEVAADVLRDAILWAVDTPRPAPAPLDRFDWRAIGQQTADVFRSLAR